MGNGVLLGTPKKKKIHCLHGSQTFGIHGHQAHKKINRLALAMLDSDFEIGYKKGSEMPADFLSRSFQETCAISILDKDWVSLQEKDTQCKLLRESLDKQWSFGTKRWKNLQNRQRSETISYGPGKITS